MKRFILLALVLALFAGCSQLTTDTPETAAITTETTETPATVTPTPIVSEDGQGYYVKNSKWEIVDIAKIAATLNSKSASMVSRSVASREVVDLIDAEAIIQEYNTATNDDQLRLYTEDVPIDQSPTVNIYYVNEGDYAPLAQVLNLDRADFVARYADFKQDERILGGIMFVDKVPPVPVVVPDTRTRHEKYHIQMVNKDDKIVVYNGFRYEESCEETWDAFNGTGPDIGYPTIDDYFASRVSAYESDIRCVGLVPDDAPWRVVSGQLYVEPTE